MDNKLNIVLKFFFVMLLMCIGITARAECHFVNYMNGQPTDTNSDKVTETNDRSAAKIPIGNLQLYNNEIQPIGTKITEINVSPLEYKVRNVGPETILWRCEPETDMSKVKFLVATNGNDRYAGSAPVNLTNASNVYYTWFNGVGIRQTMANTVVTEYWATVDVDITYDTGSYLTPTNATQCQEGWYCIRLRHIPNLKVEFFKVDGTPSILKTTSCGTAMGQSGNYECEEPSAYIQLTDNELIGGPVTFGHDKELEDSGIYMRFLGANNGFGYTLYNAANLIPAANTCWATTANTQTVTFPTTSTTHLDTDGEVFADFQIQIACTGNVTAGLNTTNFAVGIQASQASYTQAQALGLVNANQGVTALVSDDYATNAARAKHVGIFLYKDGGSTPMNFVGQPGSTGSNFPQTETKPLLSNCSWSNPDISGTGTGTCYLPITFPMGNDAGWYAFSELTQSSGDKTTNIPLRAVLKKLPSAGAVTAGSVLATAHVLVKMQ